MTITTDPAAPVFGTVGLAYADDTMPDDTMPGDMVPGEMFGPYLAVTPRVTGTGPADRHYTGTWTVTHIPTGRTVHSRLSHCIDHARLAARYLADSDVDWNRTGDDLIGDPHVENVADTAARTVAGGCYDLTRPCLDDEPEC